MNKELLTLLNPKSQSLDISSVSHNSITPEDINLILSYSGLSKEEYLFLLMKFVSVDDHRDDFFDAIKKDYDSDDGSVLDKIINLAIIECFEPKCVFCRGTGFVVVDQGVQDCPHCHEGVFTFTDEIRSYLLGLDNKEYNQQQKLYETIKEKIQNIEISSLAKIGDV